MKRSAPSSLYQFFITLPDRFYPFRTEVEGRWVRGLRAYEKAVARHERKYGHGHIGYGLNCYRSCFHVLGSIVLIVIATFVAKNYFGSDAALYILLALVVVGMAFQEFYLHPKRYRQLRKKGVLDWLSWTVPIGVYLYFFI
ncbi:MAG: hypothetical protein KBC38_00945 [Candidatus Pacebacteria bacterium]|nr:hypothetical protein [Candidatus Paceibacterota bacterium]MBP9840205.1 hypothetical protein [Candidatus Paceibacterota bacterium]